MARDRNGVALAVGQHDIRELLHLPGLNDVRRQREAAEHRHAEGGYLPVAFAGSQVGIAVAVSLARLYVRVIVVKWKLCELCHGSYLTRPPRWSAPRRRSGLPVSQ